jgi:hypothetical protein
MALLDDDRYLKRLQVEKTILADLSILFVRNNEYKKNKTRFDIANDSRFYSSESRMIREYNSINLRLGRYEITGKV